MEPISPNPRILIPDAEVSILNGPESGFESKSDHPVDHGVFGDDPSPFGLDFVHGMYL